MSHTKKQETSEGKGGPSFLHSGPRRLGSLRVLAGGWLGPKAEGGATLPPTFFFLSEKVTWEQGKVVLSWETRGAWTQQHLNIVLGALTPSHQLNIVSYLSSATPGSPNEKSAPRPTGFFWKSIHVQSDPSFWNAKSWFLFWGLALITAHSKNWSNFSLSLLATALKSSNIHILWTNSSASRIYLTKIPLHVSQEIDVRTAIHCSPLHNSEKLTTVTTLS